MATVQRMGCKEAKVGRREIIQKAIVVIQRNNSGSLNKEVQGKKRKVFIKMNFRNRANRNYN